MRSIILPVVALLIFTSTVQVFGHPHIISVDQGGEVTRDALLEDLRSVQVVFVGELHDQVGHHQAQLSIIEALDDGERPLAVGLEMFRRDSQMDLDVWIANNMTTERFIEVFNDNWSMWPTYSELFLGARDRGIRMFGLNVPRSITARVARNGFNSLPASDRMLLGNVQCEVDPSYAEYIRQAMGGYGGHGDQFLYFCEAQLLWDTVMAGNLIDFLKDNPDYRVVVLAGSGHAWKFGMPRQMIEQADISYRVVLPEIDGRINRQNLSSEYADYLWLDVGEDGWRF